MINKFLKKLFTIYLNPACELIFNSNYELLVAVILSAQCTDKRVNAVTKELFNYYNTPQKMVELSLSELEEKIYSCGFYHNKAKAILSASIDLINKFNSIVPCEHEQLLSLRGVGEKTANVVQAVGFNIPRIAVDTHVYRLAKRFGFSNGTSVGQVQKDLEKIVPVKDWINFHYAMVLHGRYVCKSQKPLCENCGLKDECKYYKININKKG
ncbi:MAG: endonuclease III [Clostridia bacterium]